MTPPYIGNVISLSAAKDDQKAKVNESFTIHPLTILALDGIVCLALRDEEC